MSATFVSANVGWVLGVLPASTGTGARLAVARTTDGGTTWTASPAPPVTFPTSAVATGARIRFADPADGWIAAPNGTTDPTLSTLWSTHDGGARWHRVAVPGGGEIAALEASVGVAHLVTIGPDASGVHIYATPAASDSWASSPTSLPIGAGPVPSANLTLHGAAGWLVENDRTVVAGARLSAGSWGTWTPPCTDANGPAFTAASSTAELVAVCDEGVWGTPAPGTTAGTSWLYTSSDAGTHFAPVGAVDTPATAHASASSVATPPGAPQTVVVGGGFGLAATFDGGHAWKTVYAAPAGQVVRVVGFTTASQGIAMVTGGTSPSALLVTRDGGLTWSTVTLSGTAAS